MPVLSMCAMKGGVGKTASALNVGACLARYGQRVLLVDADPQANLSTNLGVRVQRGQPSLGNLLTEDPLAFEAVVRKGVQVNLDLLPGYTAESEKAETRMVIEDGGEYYLREALAPVRDHYDWIIIDTPPTLGRLTLTSVLASDAVIGVVELKTEAAEGLSKTIGFVERQRTVRHSRARMIGVFINQYQPHLNMSKGTETLIAGYGVPLFNTRMPVRIKIAEAAAHQVPVERAFPNADVTGFFEDLTAEIVTAMTEIDQPIAQAV